MRFRSSLFLSLLLIALHDGASANSHWRDRSPDDRQQMRDQMREHWHQGGDRSGYSADRRDGPRGRDMPPEDRRRLREEIRGRGGPDFRQDRPPPGG